MAKAVPRGEPGVVSPRYRWLFRWVHGPIVRLLFRPRVSGLERVSAGPVLAVRGDTPPAVNDRA